MEPQHTQRKLTTILAADVEGYTRLMRADEEATLKTLSEYRDVIDGLIARHEGGVLPERVLQLRLLALKHLELFAPFSPLLVGSVLKGAVRAASDVDLHLFADDPEEVETFLAERAIPYNRETVSVRHGNRFIDYPHFYLEDQGTVIECTVYPPEERRHPAKSSITGKAMERVDAKRLARLIAVTLDKGRYEK